MQKALVTIGQSFAVLTHDLKNMIEGFEGGAYVGDEGLKDVDMELTGKGWRMVKNVSEISRVTQNLLYSAKKRKPKLQQVKPTDLARQAVKLFQQKAIRGPVWDCSWLIES